MRPSIVVLALSILSAPASLLAQAQTPAMSAAPKADCAAMDVGLPLALAPWTTKAPMTSATVEADLPKAMLHPGQAVIAALHPTRAVAYVTQPEKPGGSVASGGLFALDIAEAATYRVVLSSGAWIDLLKDDKPLTSSAHNPGPACSTARKTVDFPLQPGRYVLQVSANATPEIAILVARTAGG